MIKELYPFIQAYALIIGLAVGSFLNVIIYTDYHIINQLSGQDQSVRDAEPRSPGMIIYPCSAIY